MKNVIIKEQMRDGSIPFANTERFPTSTIGRIKNEIGQHIHTDNKYVRGETVLLSNISLWLERLGSSPIKKNTGGDTRNATHHKLYKNLIQP